MEQWILTRKGADYQALADEFHITPRMACLIRNRDIAGREAFQEYLYGTREKLHDGSLLKDMEKAITILRKKIKERQSIRVIGDYDIDGINAAYILLEGLHRLGADADSDIPNRVEDGYGLNIELIERARREGIDTVVTCDNGIAAADEIAYGKRLGMTVIVTDHHEVPYEEAKDERRYTLPSADAVIDPKQEGCGYPFKDLCGAAVAFKLVEALAKSMGRDAGEFDDLIENVALATVGDVMDLVGENRIFVKEGLRMLRRTENPGLKALMECTGIEKDKLNTYHIGFVLGPCMNASGRLDTAKRALKLLCARDKKTADALAGDLKALNDSRKEMTDAAVKQAVSQVESTEVGEDKVLVLYLPDCHESLAGIVAGRVRERYCKPVFVLTDAKEGVKGSGRSIDAYNMYEELSRCSGILNKYGGHKMAAGLSLDIEQVPKLRQMLNDNCVLQEDDLAEKVVIDMELPFRCVSEELVRELSLLEPFGKGNTKPVFAARNVALIGGRILGKNRNVLKLRVRDSEQTEIDAMYFGDIPAFMDAIKCKYGDAAPQRLLEGGARGMSLSLTYYPGINAYMGNKTPQITVTHYR